MSKESPSRSMPAKVSYVWKVLKQDCKFGPESGDDPLGDLLIALLYLEFLTNTHYGFVLR